MQEPANTTSPLRSNNRPSQCDDVDNEKDIHEMSSSNQYTQLSFLPKDSNDEDSAHRENMEEEMKLEKKRYPGASTWAPAEERLFEILFMRQDLPMLPPTWDVDLRGIPIPDVVFETSEDYPPIIYAHLKNFAGKSTSTFAKLPLTHHFKQRNVLLDSWTSHQESERLVKADIGKEHRNISNESSIDI